MRFLLAISQLFGVAACAMTCQIAGAADAPIMPRELIEMATRSSCVAVANFFERDGMIGPPFVYGVLLGETEDSAAFWCKKKVPDEQPYLLVVKANNPRTLCGCPATIEWRNFPGGLSVEIRSEIRLDEFHYVSNPERSGPMKQVTNARLIVSYYDGLSEVFYCHDGAWMFTATE